MTDYIKKADAYRIAVHGTDPDVAYKIQQLEPENVIEVPDLHLEIKPRSKIDLEKLKRESTFYEPDIRADGSVLIRPKM
jgi:hypothetical protein